MKSQAIDLLTGELKEVSLTIRIPLQFPWGQALMTLNTFEFTLPQPLFMAIPVCDIAFGAN